MSITTFFAFILILVSFWVPSFVYAQKNVSGCVLVLTESESMVLQKIGVPEISVKRLRFKKKNFDFKAKNTLEFKGKLKSGTHLADDISVRFLLFPRNKFSHFSSVLGLYSEFSKRGKDRLDILEYHRGIVEEPIGFVKMESGYALIFRDEKRIKVSDIRKGQSGDFKLKEYHILQMHYIAHSIAETDRPWVNPSALDFEITLDDHVYLINPEKLEVNPRMTSSPVKDALRYFLYTFPREQISN